MTRLRHISSFFSNLFRQEQLDRDLDGDVDGYVEMLVEEKVAAGQSRDEARRQALIEAGGVTQVKELTRDARAGAFLVSFLQDLHYGARMLRKKRAFTTFALLSLAVGIGVNTAIFSVLHAVLLEPLPYKEPQQLAIVWSAFRNAGLSRAPASGPELDELRKRSRLFESFGGIWVGSSALIGEGEPEQIKLGQVTANFFSVLGVKAALGRTFLPDEEGNSTPVIVLSDRLWRGRYAADANIVGKSIRTAGATFTVAGVMPRDFELIFPADASVPTDIQAWIPFPFPIEKNPRDLGFIRVISRLQPHVHITQAQSELDAIARDLRAQFHEFSDQQLGLQAVGMHADAVKEVRAPLLALSTAVMLVLLIACANVANLLLALTNERAREMTMRCALGASRSRIVRQLLTESLVLAVLGAAVGLGFAALILQIIPRLWPNVVPRLHAASLNTPTLLFTMSVCVIAGMMFGLAPAVGASRVRLLESLKEAGKAIVPGRQRLRRLFVLSEVTLAFVLLTGAGLMLRTFLRLLRVDPGFRPQNVLTLAVTLPRTRYPDDGKRVEFLRRLEQDLSALPGVQAVGSISHLPFDDFPNWYSYYFPEGTPKDRQNTEMADHRSVSPTVFSTLDVPLLAGRFFTETDDAKHPRVVIVDDLLA